MVWEKIFLIGQDLPMAAILVVLSERNIKILYRISQTSFLQSKQFVVPQRRRFYFLISANQKKNCSLRPCLCPISMHPGKLWFIWPSSFR